MADRGAGLDQADTDGTTGRECICTSPFGPPDVGCPIHLRDYMEGFYD